MNKHDLKIAELFSGAGGLSLGFILANHPQVQFHPVLAIDNDTKSLASYKYNMEWLLENAPNVIDIMPGIFERDVETLKVSAVLRMLKLEMGELDLLIGGPPCQGFSSSNRRGKAKSKADRNKLIDVFLNKLNEFRPKMFLIENVQGVQWTEPTKEMNPVLLQEGLFPEIESKPTDVRKFLIRKATALGYHVWYDVLDAVEFGVPQHRMRFFLFGVRSDLISDKDTINLTPYLNKLVSKQKISVEEAIGDLPPVENGQSWIGNNYDPADNEYIKKIRCFMQNKDLFDHVTTLHAEYVIERYKKIPAGGNWKDIREDMNNYKKVDNTHSNIYRRLLNDEPANTISHYRKSMIIHPSQHRGLSFREACRLQSFPDWFRFQGTNNNRQQQLANAVPPLMASMVAKAIGDLWTQLMSDDKTEIKADTINNILREPEIISG